MAKNKFVYILSQRYSGSTLLSFLLATHPEVATIGERRKFYTKAIQPDQQAGQRCSCGQLFRDCEHWQDLRQRVMSKLRPADLRTNFTEFHPFRSRWANKVWDRLPAELMRGPKLKRIYHANRVLVTALLEKTGKGVFLDSSKTVKQLRHLPRLPDCDPYVIWLVRDPRAQVSSALKYNDWTIAEATLHWLREMGQYQATLERHGLPYVTLRYEALCREPEAEMKRILAFLGLDSTAFSLEFRDYEQHIMGNASMRLGKDTQIRERTDWRERLNEQAIAQIEDMTQAYRQYYTDA